MLFLPAINLTQFCDCAWTVAAQFCQHFVDVQQLLLILSLKIQDQCKNGCIY